MTDSQAADRIEEHLIGAVLTACRIDGDVQAVEPKHFRQLHLRKVWSAIRELHDKGDAIDVDTVAHVLDVQGNLAIVGGAAALTEFIANCPSAMHAPTYASQIIEAAGKRGLEHLAGQILKLSVADGDVYDHYLEAERLTSSYKQQAGKVTGQQVKGIYTLDEIMGMEFPDPIWAIPEILPVGLAILAGKSKVGKSWMMLQIALAIGAGGRVLGKKVEAGPVLYFALEDSERRIQNRVSKIGWSSDLPIEIMPMGRFQDEFGFLENGGGERLAERIRDRGYRIVMIDTFSRAISVDQNDRQPVDQALIPIHEIAHEIECCVMLADHHNKTNFKNPDAVIDILGSTAKGANSDTIWGLYRQRGIRGGKLQITGRDVDELTLQLIFDKQTACWQSEGAVDEHRVEMTPNRLSIMAIVREEGGISGSELAKAVGRNRGSVYKDLTILCDGELLEIGKDNNYYIQATHATETTKATEATDATLL